MSVSAIGGGFHDPGSASGSLPLPSSLVHTNHVCPSNPCPSPSERRPSPEPGGDAETGRDRGEEPPCPEPEGLSSDPEPSLDVVRADPGKTPGLVPTSVSTPYLIHENKSGVGERSVERDRLPRRLERYGKAHQRAESMGAYLRASTLPDGSWRAWKLEQCGSYLEFRD